MSYYVLLNLLHFLKYSPNVFPINELCSTFRHRLGADHFIFRGGGGGGGGGGGYPFFRKKMCP